jgi:hypothetical protein
MNIIDVENLVPEFWIFRCTTSAFQQRFFASNAPVLSCGDTTDGDPCVLLIRV